MALGKSRWGMNDRSETQILLDFSEIKMSEHNTSLFALPEKLDRLSSVNSLDNRLHFLYVKNLLKSFMQFAHWSVSTPSGPFSCGSHTMGDDLVLL